MSGGDGDPVGGRAVCWELGPGPGGVRRWGVRVLVADRFLWRQVRDGGAGGLRARWSVEVCADVSAALGRAEEVTRVLEVEHGAVLVSGPWEVVLYPSEVAAMGAGRRVPPSLRSRVFTRLVRGGGG